MKRLGVYVFTFVLLVSVFGGFVGPEKGNAQSAPPAAPAVKQVTLADKVQQEDFAQQIITIEEAVVGMSGGDASPFQVLNPEGSMGLGKKYLDILQTSYDSIKNDPTKTATFLKFRTSVAYLQFIDDEKLANNGTPAYQNSLTRVRAIADQRNALAVSALNLEQSRISAAQNAANIANANAASAAANQKLAEEEAAKKCSVIGENAIINCLDVGISWLIKNTILQIAGFFLWLTSNMFNYVIKVGVLNFSEWATSALYPIWVIFRQIVSLVIVFIGLYLGLMYILGKEGFEKYLVWVVMFAIFVNFSYSLTRTAIDISNVISLKIYVSAVGEGALDDKAPSTAGAIILSRLGLQELAFSATSAGTGDTGMLGKINSIPGALLAVVYVLYAAYIFFMITALFIMRTLAFIFIIVASPLLLVDSVFPLLGGKAKELRGIFFEQLAIGPIFMIMLALTLKFLEIFGKSGALGSFGSTSVSTFFNILMMLIMLMIMLKVTKASAGALGEYAMNKMGAVGGYATGAVVGGAMAGGGLLARKGLGSLAAKVRDSDWVKNNQHKVGGRLAYNLSNTAANSTFDARNSSVAKKYGAKLGISSGMGSGGNLGYEEENKKKTEEFKKIASRIKTKHERDVPDGKGGILHRKGDVDEEGVRRLEEFHQKNGGAIFQTKKQQEDLADPYIDDVSSHEMTEYNKLHTKAKKADFQNSLTARLAELKKTDGSTPSPKAQALMRTLFDIKKKEKEEAEAFELQLEKAIDRYNATPDPKKAEYLANLEADMRSRVKSAVAPPVTPGSTQTTTQTTTPAPTTQAAQTTTQPVGQPTAQSTAGQTTPTTQASNQPPVSQTTTQTPIDIDLSQPYDVGKMSLMDFAKKAAAARAAKNATPAQPSPAPVTTTTTTPPVQTTQASKPSANTQPGPDRSWADSSGSTVPASVRKAAAEASSVSAPVTT